MDLLIGTLLQNAERLAESETAELQSIPPSPVLSMQNTDSAQTVRPERLAENETAEHDKKHRAHIVSTVSQHTMDAKHGLCVAAWQNGLSQAAIDTKLKLKRCQGGQVATSQDADVLEST